MSNKAEGRTKQNTVAGRALTFFSPLVESISGKPISAFVQSSQVKGGNAGGRAKVGSSERAYQEVFDRLAARDNPQGKQGATGKAGSGKQGTSTATESNDLKNPNFRAACKAARSRATAIRRPTVFTHQGTPLSALGPTGLRRFRLGITFLSACRPIESAGRSRLRRAGSQCEAKLAVLFCFAVIDPDLRERDPMQSAGPRIPRRERSRSLECGPGSALR